VAFRRFLSEISLCVYRVLLCHPIGERRALRGSPLPVFSGAPIDVSAAHVANWLVFMHTPAFCGNAGKHGKNYVLYLDCRDCGEASATVQELGLRAA